MGEIPNGDDFFSEQIVQRELSFGEKAVGLTFNPSGDEKVNKAKQLMADALDLLKEVEEEKSKSGVTWEANVFRTNAFNKIVDAQMSLVKYITWNN
jgi:hypothetical protein